MKTAQADQNARPLTSLASRRTQLKNMTQGPQRPQTSAAGTQQEPKEDSDLNARYSASSANFKRIDLRSSQKDDVDLGFSNNSGPHHQSMISLSQSTRMPQIKNDFQIKTISKTIPKNILQDKERLYEDLIQKKQMINQLNTANYRLQTQVQTLKIEVRRYEQLAEMNDMASSQMAAPMKRAASAKMNPYSASVAESSSIVPSLKKQVIDLSNQLNTKEKEMTEIKRNVKLTKISELEVELKQYMDETIRLRRLLQQALHLRSSEEDDGDGTMEEKFLSLMNQINNLKGDLAKSHEVNEGLQAEIAENNKQIKAMSRQTQKSAKDKSVYKRMLIEKERELEKYEDAGLLGQTSYRRSGLMTEGEFKVELERKISECNSLSTRVQEKDKKIGELESKIKDLQIDFQEKLNSEAKEKEALKAKSEKEHLEFVELQAKYNQFLSLKPNKERRVDTAKTQQGKSQYIEFSGQETPQQQKSDFAWTPSHNASRKKLTNGEMNLIHMLGAEIRARLRYNAIPFSHAHTYLLSREILAREQASFEEIKAALQADPFCVTNEEDLNLFCNYLIDEQASVTMHQQQQQQLLQLQSASSFHASVDESVRVNKTYAIESAFKRCIGFYMIYTKLSHPEHYAELQRFVCEKEKQLRSQFSSGLIVDRKKFEQYVKTSDFVLESSLLDFIQQVSYESTHSVNSIDLEKVFKFFFSNTLTAAAGKQHKNEEVRVFVSSNQNNETAAYGDNSNADAAVPNDAESYRQQQELDRKFTDLKKLHSQEENLSLVNSMKDSGVYGNANTSHHHHHHHQQPQQQQQHETKQTHFAAAAYLGAPKSNEKLDDDKDEYYEDNEEEDEMPQGKIQVSKKNSLMPKIDEEEDLSNSPKKKRLSDGEEEEIEL